jgi:hypothetical protein
VFVNDLLNPFGSIQDVAYDAVVHRASSGSVKVKCVVAFDSGIDAIEEIVRLMLPDEWRPHVKFATDAKSTDLIDLVRNALPALLVIHTNLFHYDPEWLAGCVAASPNTRYLVLSSWEKEVIDALLKPCEPLHASVEVLRTPFVRAQLIAALEPAFGLLT